MASSYALPHDSQPYGPNTSSTISLASQPPHLHNDQNSMNKNATAHANNSHSHEHNHHHGHHHHAQKSKSIGDLLPALGKTRRARGESDLGRASSRLGTKVPLLTTISDTSGGSDIVREVSTGLLLAVAFFLPALTRLATLVDFSETKIDLLRDKGQPDLQALRGSVLDNTTGDTSPAWSLMNGVGEASALTTMILLMHGIAASYSSQTSLATPVSGLTSPWVPTDTKPRPSSSTSTSASAGHLAVMRALAIFLPLLASMKIGGWRVSMILLAAYTMGLANQGKARAQLDGALLLGLVAPVVTSAVLDVFHVTASGGMAHILSGYGALIPMAFLLPAQLDGITSVQPVRGLRVVTPMSPSVNPWATKSQFSSKAKNPSAPLTVQHATISFMSALLSGIASISVFAGLQLWPDHEAYTLLHATLTVVIIVIALRYADYQSLQSRSKIGYIFGMVTSAVLGLLTLPQGDWYEAVGNTCLALLYIVAVISAAKPLANAHTRHLTASQAQNADHIHEHHSSITAWLLESTDPDSLIHNILREKDSRRIAYFTCLNFAFMLVQGLYGHLSGSLGLLSDTVHMFFDCLGLIVGLGAAIASKWPPSRDRPYGWAKLNTLAGFGNGIFLMLVSLEFVWEAIEGIIEGRELRRVKELFVVSSLGLLVNLVGLFAFGHAHAGHDHSHSHGHDEHNENMHGIFLHVAADAGGSLAVIISTALTLWQPWYLWDPLATIIIAMLIFAAAVPLVVSSGQKLLLIVPGETEYVIKNFLQEVGEIRGIIAYAEPRFWTVDREDASHDHMHSHACQDHKHEHDSAHSHDHHHDHNHSHSGTPPITLTGSLRVTVMRTELLEEVRIRAHEIAEGKGIDLTVHVEHASPVVNGSAVIS